MFAIFILHASDIELNCASAINSHVYGSLRQKKSYSGLSGGVPANYILISFERPVDNTLSMSMNT